MSGGETGAVIGVAVCSATDTVTFGALHACGRDESVNPLPATGAIVCSALFPQQTGRTLEVKILSGASDAAKPYADTIDAPIWSESPTFKPVAPQSTFPAGDYVCRISLNGVTVAEKPFSIGG